MKGKKPLEHIEGQAAAQDRVQAYSLKNFLSSHPVLSAAATGSVPMIFLLLIYVKKLNIDSALYLTGIYSFLIPIAIIDCKHKIIPNRLLPVYVIIAFLFAIYRIVSGASDITNVVLEMLTGMLLGGGVFASAAIMTKGGVGMGDIKLFAVLGLALGFFQTFYLIIYTLMCATAFGLIMIMTGKASVKTRIAVGPYVLTGIVLLTFIN